MTASGAAVARLPRPVKLFGFVSLLNDFASEMIYPLLPAFVTGVLGAGPQALGALDGVAEFAASVVKFGAGRLADRTARRGPLIVLGYAIAVLVRPIIALTGAAWQVIGLRVVDRIGKGIRTPPRDALMADVTRSEEHTSELQSQSNLVCRLLLEKKKTRAIHDRINEGMKKQHGILPRRGEGLREARRILL